MTPELRRSACGRVCLGISPSIASRFLRKFYAQGKKILDTLFINLSSISSGPEMPRLNHMDCFLKEEPSLNAGPLDLLGF